MLIPTVLSLSEFFAKNFPNISWYPYWYLGNPYHYLIGPVVPIALAIVQSSKFKVQSYDLYLGFILLSFVVGGIGIYFLLRDWRVGKLQAIASGVLYTVLPAGFFLLNFQNGLNHIAFGFLPFALLLFKEFLVKENKFLIVFLTLTITIMLLTSLSIILPLIIGILALFVGLENKQKVEEKIGKIILIVLLSLSLSSLWYTPKFWWVITTNPSLGGVPFLKLVWSILQFLIQFLPLVLAIIVVKWRNYKPKGHILFGFLFFASFLFLSFVRFVSDPDFVMDWVSFGLEMQFGAAILLGSWFGNSSKEVKGQKSKLKITTQNSKIIICGGLILSSTILTFLIFNSVINKSKSDYKTRIISMLKNNVKESERVFLSGSSVFFINSKLNIQQVRGGKDEVSIHPSWAMASYQIREGTHGDLAYDWLKALGVSYVLVHDKYSVEPFSDFKYPLKFADQPSGFKLMSADRGDAIYKVQDSHIARVADKKILSVQKPKDGADERAINNYNLSFRRPLAVNYQKPNEITIEGSIKQGEVISLAVSYDSLWHIAYGKGKIASDSLGNMVIIPEKEGAQQFELVYKRSMWDMVTPLGLSVAIVILLIKYQKIAPYVRKRVPKLSIGLREGEEY